MVRSARDQLAPLGLPTSNVQPEQMLSPDYDGQWPIATIK